ALDVEPVIAVQDAVAEIIVGRSVQVVGARLGDHIDRRAGAAELGAIGVGHDLEFLDRIHAQGSPDDGDPLAVVPRVYALEVVYDVGGSHRTGAGDGVVVLVAVGGIRHAAAASASKHNAYAGRQGEQVG